MPPDLREQHTHPMQKNTPIQTYQSYPVQPELAETSARKTAAPPPTRELVRWWMSPGEGRRGWIYGVLLAATLLLFFVSNPPAVSPLITSYLDLLDELSAWAIPRIVELGGISFYLSLAFVIVLTIFLWYTFRLCHGSYIQPSPDDPTWVDTRYFSFRVAPGSEGYVRIITGIYVVMLLSNVALFYYYAQRLEYPEKPLEGSLFRVIYFLAITSRLAGVFIGMGLVIQRFLQDFGGPIWDFTRRYWKYFYPAILSLAIVLFVFTKMDQFDGLFIDLMNSRANFLLFSLFLFPVSIVIIWFAPNYLMFTDQQFSNRFKTWDLIDRIYDRDKRYRRAPRLLAWAFLHKRLFPQLDRLLPGEPPADFMPRATGMISYPPAAFHRVRAVLALLYILTLVSIASHIYFDNQPQPSSWGDYLAPFVGLLAFAYIIYSLRITTLAQRPENRVMRPFVVVAEDAKLGIWARLRERAVDKRNAQGEIYRRESEAVYFVKDRFSFWFGFGILLVALLAFLRLTLLVSEATPWYRSFAWFLGFLACSVISFAWLGIYRPFYQGYTFNRQDGKKRFPSDGFMDRLDHLTIQSMLTLMTAVFLIAFCFFIWALTQERAIASSLVGAINPLNIYLLLINGLLAFFILADRLVMLYNLRQHYRQVSLRAQGKPTPADPGLSQANLVWGWVIIGVLLATAYLGNSYHEIRYQSGAALEAAQLGPPTLEDYTRNFLADTAEQGPIIFITADGGGLKACYWTMLNLLELDEMGLYDGHVFALSGASGGTIGLSMYNYLKAQNLPVEDIREYIERIGQGNYLSGDFTGLLCRFPVNYWPDLPGLEAHHYDDRMDAMANAYFRIVGEKGGGYEYARIRQQPFYWPWTQKPDLPLLIINTARAEDGLLGTVTPLAENPLVETIDLTRNADRDFISYPDATFLSNRFPIASPAARITGKGHFLDAGNADNSGINSAYSLLRTLKAREFNDTTADSLYRRFFARKIVLLSIRNAASRYVRDAFLDQLDSMNRYPYKSEFSANTGVALNTGISGVPIAWDDYLRDSLAQKLGILDEYVTINLPFRLQGDDVFSLLGGELKVPNLPQQTDSLNHLINAHLRRDSVFTVMPPLGRLLAKPIRDYMDKMVDFPEVRRQYEQVKGARN
ncbi:hypothetical protein QWY85_14045 [Neolewinella lacunae]|uniref:PNPLA domain-containing protein n=1 Tax=Neolewinella lacunae TaxID=1517758 RepID=A0A923TBU5_9BACT|nr:hypothetical protein [Neolewinella lacunae]MBC6992997.1 hypothetical protein [Neolewinella lacunae]MDN3635787.1 hypothetical protein [Neolewinella lacunae]